MRKLAYILLLMALSVSYSYGQIPKADALFDTIFVENFQGSTLNTSKWLPRYPWGQFFLDNKVPAGSFCGGTDVSGMNFNTADTVNRKIAGGTCKLIGKKGDKKLERWTFPGSVFTTDSINFKYTNAMLCSKAGFKFGYFEIKFRMPSYTPSVYGVFSPTFWLYNNGTKTHWSEIDVFEIDATLSANNMTNSIHIDTSSNDSYVWNWNIPAPLSNRPSVNLSNWHTAAVNWTPNYIDFYLDSTLLRHVQNDSLRYLIEMPMIIENGVPSTNFCHSAIDTVNTPFPVTYEIDYVKAWQPICECSTHKTSCSVTESTYVSKIYKDLTLGGSGCSATFDNKTALSAEANDFVLLDEGFQVGTNINMTIDVQSYCSDSIKYTPNKIGGPTPPDAGFIQTYKRIKDASQ